jgi:hypothetical protein
MENYKINKVIFLDIDGPMIPTRALYMEGQDWSLPHKFDPCAVGLLNRLATKSKSKIVVHSHWRKSTDHKEQFPCIRTHLISQGIREEFLLEDDHLCPGDRTTDRWEDIVSYLEVNKEITRYVILEDLPLKKGYEGLAPSYVPIDFDDGFNFKAYNKALRIMGLEEESLLFC